jgi:exopolysaccharide biosynthesis polyprenyl glycosylphosphotransferase
MSQHAAIELRTDEARVTGPFLPEPHLVAVPAGAATPTVDQLATVTLKSSPPAAVGANESRQRRILIGADVAAVAAACGAVLWPLGATVAVAAFLLSLLLLVALLKVAGLYNREELRLRHTTLDEAPVLLQVTGLLCLGIAVLLPSVVGHGLSSDKLALLWAAMFVAVTSGRVAARVVVRRVVPVERCLIIGDAGGAQRIRQRLASGRARAEVIACLASDELRALGGADTVHELVHELDIHRIILAPMTTGPDGGAVDLVRIARAVGVRVSVVPGILEAIGSSAAFDEVEGMGFLGVPRFGLPPSSHLLKRAFDLTATAAALVILSPLLVAIAIAVRLDSKGPVFFRQVRVGRGGEHFSIVKFRSMVTDAEALKDGLRALSVAGTGLFKVPDDPRVTRVGRFLRKSSLDELPQLLNVLRGEMSLVGPRPLVVDEDSQVLGLDRSRLRFTPGMTGPWQLQRSRVPLNEMVEIDYLYAGSWSMWLDLKILLRTVQHVLRRGNL